VNRWWICDEGRYGFRWIDDESRLLAPRRREGDRAAEIGWDDALGLVADGLRRYRPEEIGVFASPRMSNEDLFVLRALLDHLGVDRRAVGVPPREPGREDDLLVRADKSPNAAGAVLCGLGSAGPGPETATILSDAAAGRIKLFWVFHDDLYASTLPADAVDAALAGAELLVFQGTNANRVSARAHLVLPSAAHAERDGTFTNFEGRVQRFRPAVPALGAARPDWDVLARLLRRLGAAVPVAAAARAEHCFAALADTVPAFRGMTYRGLGDAGAMVRA
jgi:NADH-quinone oxidoreductase subunit G